MSTMVTTPATETQLSFLQTLWEERLDDQFDAQRIRRMGYAKVSALITKLKTIEPLPATEEQLARIAAMDRESGFDRVDPITTRSHANIVLRKAAQYQERQRENANVDQTLAALGVDIDSLTQRVEDDSDLPF